MLQSQKVFWVEKEKNEFKIILVASSFNHERLNLTFEF